MNQYLLLIRCSLDDVPMKLFETGTEAVEAANMLADSPAMLEGALMAAGNVMGIDVSEPHAIAVATYVDGDMTAMCIVRGLS